MPSLQNLTLDGDTSIFLFDSFFATHGQSPIPQYRARFMHTSRQPVVLKRHSGASGSMSLIRAHRGSSFEIRNRLLFVPFNRGMY